MVNVGYLVLLCDGDVEFGPKFPRPKVEWLWAGRFAEDVLSQPKPMTYNINRQIGGRELRSSRPGVDFLIFAYLSVSRECLPRTTSARGCLSISDPSTCRRLNRLPRRSASSSISCTWRLHYPNGDSDLLDRPVGLKEAALDSPTFRATTIYFSEQVDLLEKWLEEYLKSTNRFVTESAMLENIVAGFSSHALLPSTITEAVLDHDYSVLAMRKYMEGAKDFWMSALTVIKRLNALVADPIRSFLQNELRAFKVRLMRWL